MKLAAVLLVCGCAHPAPKVPLSPNLASFAFYVGDWTCDGTQYDATGKATEHLKLAIAVRPDIENWFHIGVLLDGKPLTSELKGYDPASRSWHHLWTSTDGTSGSLTSTTGWQGDAMAFDEDHPDPKERTRMTFTRIDATHYTHRAEVDTGAGYHLDFEKRCTKS